ncbi:MAG: FAD-dependent monooxygenase [Chroococcidiopsidaceae cyanobacterium CP_BM_ER_R8_30]|nr:FAD-dependent monooxygenase [Chroococcidiopsidaceae cyanobacterium CP_BM_ER_R8_30]
MLTKESSLPKKINYSHRNVLIIGGGPAGLATALMLAKRGWTDITILEKRAAADYYEPDKSFNYLIDGRGQKLTDFLGLTYQILEIGVPSTEFYLTKIKPNGSRKTLKIPLVDPNRKTAYWVTRRAFVLLLYQEIERNWQDHITVLFSTKCTDINKIAINNGEEEKLEIIAHQEDGIIIKFEPCLLVGCEGIHSIARNTLKDWDKSTLNRFEMRYFPSPSSHLRYKVLSLPPNFPLDHMGKEHAACNMAYAIHGAFRNRKRSVSLGLLPLKNPDDPRTANIITQPDHDIWQLKTSEEIYNFFEQAFIQLPIYQIVSPEEAARFAKSEGGYFPTPQYCSGLHFLLRQKQAGGNNQSSAIGVVLLGDAIHCFPPDIGQGVNSALEDVYVLNEALSRSDDNLSDALPLYESLRFPDVKALVRLAQIAFPWQYNQAPLRRLLWNVNFFLRLLLNRLLPYFFSPPAFLLIQNYQLSYQEILVMAQRTTRILYVLGLMLACGFLALGLRTLYLQRTIW